MPVFESGKIFKVPHPPEWWVFQSRGLFAFDKEKRKGVKKVGLEVLKLKDLIFF